jgi:2-polyprenyl-6-hydroxyphenyl methylase / 3-demethylubiquinone-9 3-methyltransferase
MTAKARPGGRKTTHSTSFTGASHQVVTLGRHGLRIGEIAGLAPRSRRPLVLLNLIRANRGQISYGELSRRLDLGRVKSTSVACMGFATKTG